MERLGAALGRAVQERSGPALLALALFAMGVVFGALAVGALGERDRQELMGAVGMLFRTLERGGAALAPGPELARAAGAALKSLALWWALGVTAVGSLGVLGLVFLRGFATGYAAAFLGAELGWRGALHAAAALLPHNLVAVPALLLAAAGAVRFSMLLLQGYVRQTPAVFYRELGRYSLFMLGCGAALVAAAFIQAYVTPVFMRLAARL